MEENKVIQTSPTDVGTEDLSILARWLQDPRNEIPDDIRVKFAPMVSMLGKTLRLAVLAPCDEYKYNITFKYVCELLKTGLYEYAMEEIFGMTHALSLTASLGGRQLELGVTGGVSRTEQISKSIGAYQRKGFMSKLSGAFGSNKHEGEQE